MPDRFFMIPPAVVERIRQAADVLEVVQDYVTLKKKGSNWGACCPFHQEKTPSFAVSPAKGIYKCFGCGKAGDAIRFVMEIEQLDFPEALRHLARKYHIEVEEEEEQTSEQQAAEQSRESLMIVLRFAKDYFRGLLFNHEEGRGLGLSYLRERGFSDATIEAFELGYSLEAWTALTDEALRSGYQPDVLERAGLTVVKEEGNKRYDRFRGRVVFPIHAATGRVIGFGARILRNDAQKSQPKYINSPESEVYNKSQVLYGLYQARQAIRQHDVCYLVEGYTDVISLYQGGTQNVVASSGTSLTEEQIRLMARYTANVTLLYDGDPAGIKASLRGVDMLLAAGFNVRVVLFPDGEDPDSYLRRVGGAAFKTYLTEKSTDFITFKASLLSAEAAQDPFRKAEAIRELVSSVTLVPDPIKRSVLFRQVSALLGVEEGILLAESNKIRINELRRRSKMASDQATAADEVPGEEVHPDLERDLAADLIDATPSSTDAHLRAITLGERTLLRLLIEHGHQPTTGASRAIHLLLAEIEDLNFINPLHQKILDHLRLDVEAGQLPNPATFVHNPETDVQQLAIDLTTSRWQLSSGWREKHNINTTQEGGDAVFLEKEIVRLVTLYKWMRLKQDQESFLQQHRQACREQKTEEEMLLLRTLMHIKTVEVALTQPLGNVVANLRLSNAAG